MDSLETSEQSAGRRRKVVTVGVVGAVMLIGTAGAVGVLNKGEAGTVTATTPSIEPGPDSASASAMPNAPQPQAPKTIPATLFGMNVSGLSSGTVATGASSLRLWDAGVTWRQLEPQRGAINWAPLDKSIANAKKSGFTNIAYVLGSTPEWAASRTSPAEVYGAGSASFPKKQSYYLDYVRRVAQRYKGKINSYQIWNEADLKEFYSGSPGALASLTAATYKLVKSIDAKASVAAAGLVPRPGRFEPGTFEDLYLKGLKARGWPVDAFMISMYPENQDPDLRGTYSQILKNALQRLAAPPTPVWESEANYASADLKVFTTASQVRLMARTYIDSPGFGLDQVYWYGWTNQWPPIGVRTTTPSGEITAAGVAYATIKSWMAGKQWFGCTADAAKVTRCPTSGGGPNATIVYSKKARTIPVPAGTKRICYLDGRCAPVKVGDKIKLTSTPLQLQATT